MGMKTKGFLKKVIASSVTCSLIVASTSFGGQQYDSVFMPNQKALAANEATKAPEKITEGEISLPTGGVEFAEENVSKKELQKMPAFTGDAEKVTLDGNYTASTWNQSGKVTYGSSDYGYKQLTSSQQTAYMQLLYATAGSNLDGTGDCFIANTSLNGAGGYSVACPSGVSMSDMKIAYSALYEDHPEFYWLQSGYSYSGSSFIVQVDALYDTKAERDTVDSKIQATNGERAALLSAYDRGSDEYGKMIALHNQIMEDFTYAYNGSRPESAAWAHNIVGALSGQYQDSDGSNKVVCEGYAKTFQYILNMKGIDNIYIIGNANGGGHAWNMISIANTWYYMDLTWDDQSNGYGYTYTCMPASFFKSSHTAYTTSSSFWLYSLPEADDTRDLSRTYFGKYNAYATTSTYTNAQSFVQSAGASSPNNDLVILASSVTMITEIARELGLNSYMRAQEYNGYMVFVEGGATRYKVTSPATTLSIDKTSYTLDASVNRTFQLTFSATPSGSNDYVNITLSDSNKVKLDNKCVPIKSGKATVTVTGMRNGNVTITGKPLVGSAAAASCQVTVTGSALAQTLYTDSACSNVIEESDAIAYVNGGKVKNADNISVNKKAPVFYTDMATPVYRNSRGKNTNGKVIVGITSSETTPTVSKGKIVSDAAATKIAKASITKVRGSNHKKITVTAQKDVGQVYLWVLGLGENNEIVSEDYCPITIKAAPSKITLQDKAYTAENANKYTSDGAMLDEAVYVYVKPTYTDSEKNTLVAEEASFQASLGNDSSYAKIEQISSFGYKITGTALKNTKATTVKATFTCNENGKKATFTLKFANPVTSVKAASLEGKSTLAAKGDSAKIKLSINTAGETDNTTDKARVYITNGTASDGVAVVSKSSKYKGTISGNDITLTLQKAPAEEATVYVLYKDSITKKEVAYRLATIDKNGTITLENA